MNQHDFDHAMKMVTKRMDDHGVDLQNMGEEVKDFKKEMRENFALVFKEIKILTKQVHQVELQGVREDGNIKVKMATMSGEMKAKIAGIGAISSTATYGLVELLKALIAYLKLKGHA